jgi:hypothetical protein
MAARLMGHPERADHTSAADLLLNLTPCIFMTMVEKMGSFYVKLHDLTREKL